MLKYLLFTILITNALCVQDILSFGAVPNEDTLQAQFKNTEAILKAIKTANSSQTM